MQDHDLDRLLQELAAQPKPALPSGFRDGIWRQIRHRQAAPPRSFGSWLDWALAPLVRPQPIFAALAFSLMVGLFLGIATGSGIRVSGATRAMELDVFGLHAPGLPTTLLEGR
ncbi:MAG: hypothetical protein PW734_11195 [Verrucomicrobium sp.]|nr:hypothetical protein [Verrucomicrobium sp.]